LPQGEKLTRFVLENHDMTKLAIAVFDTVMSRLDRACTFGREEFRDPKKSVLQFKSRK
jgi:hypothetical protein